MEVMHPLDRSNVQEILTEHEWRGDVQEEQQRRQTTSQDRINEQVACELLSL